MSAEAFEELPDAAPSRQNDGTAAAAASSSSGARGGITMTTSLDGIALTGADSEGLDQPKDGAGNLIQKFRQMWITEKASPELLYYETDVVEEVKFAVDERQKKLDELSRTSAMQHLCALLQIELDRISFVLHSYHRCRLKKLEKYATYILTAGQIDRCSAHEAKFVDAYAKLLSSHLSDSFLSGLPEKLSAWFSLDTPSDDPLIVKPAVHNDFVTFRVKYQIDNYPLPDDEAVNLNENDIVVGNWKDFKPLFTDGQIELI